MSDTQILPGTGRGTSEAGGGAPSTELSAVGSATPHLPLHHPADGPPPRLGEEPRAQFPALADGWHYLDSAATAHKPQSVIDATVRAMGAEYATVHRGVYARSATMTRSFEASRERMARFLGGVADEIVFTRGATEAINLVAHRYSPKGRPRRVLLSELEHHSNIVPWQLAGWEVAVCPLTPNGRIDLDAAEALVGDGIGMIALAHVSNALGSVLDVPRAAELARRSGAKLLLDGCQSAARMPVDVAALGCDFYACSGHKMYGPTGIGALWGRGELLDAMPPWQGGGAMIDEVTFERTTFAPPPQRFEAGTPAIVEAAGIAAALDWIDAVGRDAIERHEAALVAEAREALRGIGGVTLYGPEDSAGILAFNVDGVHPHDVGTILDEAGVAVRAGHHCAQPLMRTLGVGATARASFAAYSDRDDIAALVDGIARVRRIFG